MAALSRCSGTQNAHPAVRRGPEPGSTFLRWVLGLCLTSVFKKYVFAIKPFSLLRDHFRDVSFVPLNHARSEAERYNSGLKPSNSL
jgi:hypothetical protein